MKKKSLLTVLLGIIFSVSLFSQANNYNSNIWYFGKYAGITFNTGHPVAIYGGQTNTIEGVATICDLNGNLLFYTEGTTIWNRFHQVMPNGSGLLGHYSAAQSSIIVPDLNNNNKFYVFTVDAVENHLQNGLRYSVVDMTLDNGKGDVVSGQKNILLHAPVAEKVTAVLDGSENGYWILTHEWNTDAYLAYHLTASGLNTTPVISHSGIVHSGGAYPSYAWHDGWMNAVGGMKANMQGNKLAVVRMRAPLELCDFNRYSGVVSNCIEAPVTFDQSAHAEFSPNQTKLYLSTVSSALGTTNYIYQFDLSQSNSFNNVQVLTHLTDGCEPSAIQVGPDGNVYVSEYNPNTDVPYLSKIENPDMVVPYATYVRNAVPLTSDASAKRGLPNLYYYKGFHFITGINENNNSGQHIVFTNPENNNCLYLKNPYPEKINLFITDITGKFILNTELYAFEEKQVNLPVELNGIYLVKSIHNNTTSVQKIAVY
ncbi:MAG: T9SS type A sorting domain-containing protein [Bacteroidales bacterium]|nr:T9SS type A sorting domain-containing protein [Bacteroidales bacterium]